MSRLIAMFALAVTALVVPSQARPVHTALVSDANNNFGLSLVNILNDNQKNVFISPYSISTAFAMLYTGAKGTTSEQMRRVLGYESAHLSDQQLMRQASELMSQLEANNGDNTLTVANKLVVSKNFDVIPKFEDRLKEYFRSQVSEVDFTDPTVKDQINDWVSRETHEKIKTVFDEPLDPMTKLVLLNAVYFKGVFQTKFNTTKTTEQVFYGTQNRQTKTQMMSRLGLFNYTRIEGLDSSLLEIPYTSDHMSLYVVLPDGRQDLKTVTERVDAWPRIETAITKLQERKVEVTIPKFKVETSYSLNDKLSALGMSSLFTRSADFSGIDGRQDLEVSQVVHKAYVEVNEEGTEAAAVTGIQMRLTAVVEPPMIPVFRADHPFVFFIRDNTSGVNIFMGVINEL